MLLRSLRLRAFRAHVASTADFASKVNLIHGPNGAGKTNILEAAHYLCLTKSFLTTNDRYALRKDNSFFEIEGCFEGRWRKELKVRLAYAPKEGKRLFVNGAPLERLSKIVGVLPVVAFSQLDHALTAGGPEERRRFLNNILSQARPVYLDDLMAYRRAMRQRNELLSRHRRTSTPSELESWNSELINLGARIIAARLRFLGEFVTFLEEAYQHVESVAEKPSITYAGIAPLEADATEASIQEIFRGRLASVAQRERDLGRTLVGPHRDELVFRIDNFVVRQYASQGQRRTFGMAMKLAQFLYLNDRLEEAPILLLDDVFDPLDARRTEAFLALLQSDAVGQSLITAAQPEIFQGMISFDSDAHRLTRVEAGGIAQG